MFHIILFSILGVGLAYMLIPPFLRMLRESNDDFVKSIKENKNKCSEQRSHIDTEWLNRDLHDMYTLPSHPLYHLRDRE